MKLQNKNFIYNCIYQIFNIIIPLITTPYISRVLGVEQVGVYSYTYSIVYYFMLFSMLGINNYGERKITKNSSSKATMTNTFLNIYLIQLLLNITSIFLYIIFVNIYNYEYIGIMWINIIFLISVAFDINWFFFGIEKFKITVTRNIIIKLLSMILIFIFIKGPMDLWKYCLIMSLSTIISQAYLWLFIKNELDYKKKDYKIEIKKHLKPILILFIPIFSYSIYRVMDKTMIGYFSNVFELGNYESAEKIINIPISLVTALGTVMMPYMAKKKEEDIKKDIMPVFELMFFIIIPIIIGMNMISDDFTNLFFGTEFSKTSNIMRFLSITILFISIANVIRTNYLIPCKKDKIYVISTIIGAIANFIINIIFIAKYGAYGACIGTIIAELLVMLYQAINSKSFINFKEVMKIFMKYLIKSIPIIPIVILINICIDNVLFKLIIQVILSIIYYIIINYKYIIYDFLGRKKVIVNE